MVDLAADVWANGEKSPGRVALRSGLETYHQYLFQRLLLTPAGDSARSRIAAQLNSLATAPI